MRYIVKLKRAKIKVPFLKIIQYISQKYCIWKTISFEFELTRRHLNCVIIKVDPLTWINYKQIKNISESNSKWNLLVFIKNKVCMYFFETRKVWNVICCQCFLKAFENRAGILLRFFWKSNLRSSLKELFLKFRKPQTKAPASEFLF